MNNNEKIDKNTTGKLKPLAFAVTFYASRVYSDGKMSAGEPLNINEIQDIFAQSTIFVAGTIDAIHRLTYEMQSVDESDETTIRSCETLTVIGKTFLKKMEEQFDRLLQIAEGKQSIASDILKTSNLTVGRDANEKQ